MRSGLPIMLCVIVTGITLLSGGVATASAATGLVAAYPFDAPSVLTDATGTGNNGSGSNVTSVAGGKFGGALSFNGVNSWVTISDNPSLHFTTGMTVEAWVNPAAGSGTAWQAVAVKEQVGEVVFGMYANSNRSSPVGIVYTGTSEKSSYGRGQLRPGVWTHVAETYNGSKERLYVNGALVSSILAPGPLPTSNGPLRLGGDSLWKEFFKGLIDEVRVYNRPLSSSEIATDMATPISAAPDVAAPSVPAGLSAVSVTGSSVSLGWSASSDNVGVAGYGVYLGGSSVSSSVSTGSTVGGLACGTVYAFSVDAFDAAGNRSGKATVSASTAACPVGARTGNVFLSPSGSDSGGNCRRFATAQVSPGGVVCQTLARAYDLAAKGDTVVMAGGTYGSQLRLADGAVAKAAAGGGCDRYAADVSGCVNFVPEVGASVSWSPGAEIKIEVPYVHLKGLTIPSGPYGDIYAGINDSTSNVRGIWLDSVDIPQFFATSLDGFAITDSRVGPCVTSSTYTTCDSQIKGGYLAADTPTLEHDILIDNVVFHDTWRTGSTDHLECLLVFDAKNITVRNSSFVNCGIIDFFLASTSGHPLTGALVENTVFDRPGSHGPTSPSNQTSQGLLVSCQSSTCSNITVRNNSFVAGAQMITQATSGTFVGSIVYTGNASGGSTVCEGFTTYSYNVFNGSSCGSNSLNANPGFLSPDTNPIDLHVGLSSPVAGAGNPANAPATDHDGHTRPATPAAGAYEPR
jgi:hypothetical protein